MSTGGCASTYTPSRLARVLPARSAVVMTTTDSPSGRSALTAYLPAASACPLALTSPPTTVTVAYGSVMPLNVAGSVLMRPSIRSSSSSSLGMLVSTVKRQSLRTSRRKRLELLARNATACSPSARSPALMVSVSPSRRDWAVTSSPSSVTATSLRSDRPLMSRTTVGEGSLTYASGPGVTAETRGTP